MKYNIVILNICLYYWPPSTVQTQSLSYSTYLFLQIHIWHFVIKWLNDHLSHHFWCEYHFDSRATEHISVDTMGYKKKTRSHLLSLNWQCFKSRTCLCSVRNILPHDGSRRQEPGQRQAWYSSRSAKYIGSRTGKAVEHFVLFIKHNLYGNAYHGYWCIPWQYITLVSLQ